MSAGFALLARRAGRCELRRFGGCRVARLFFSACIMSMTGALPVVGATVTVLPLSLASINWLRRSWNSSL